MSHSVQPETPPHIDTLSSQQGATLMVQGTTSDAGKSTVVTGLCRALYRRGFSVAPFKPQNMALNSAVTPEGGEIGRAQAVQAQACRVPAHTDMNPVLLKPNTDMGSQVIVNGRAVGTMNARCYHAYKPKALHAVLHAHSRLSRKFELVLVEGAGSPAEINLREGDIANMGFAEAVDCPVLLVADIDRGGVFAHLVGTLELLSHSERQRIKGFVINRFRGDIELLKPGLIWLEARTGIRVLGVLPHLEGLFLDAEDSMALQKEQAEQYGTQLRVVVPATPRISNHTDFDALRLNPHVNFSFIQGNDCPPNADLIILPGSKSTRADLAWLRSKGWDRIIHRHLRYGGKLMGLCGGFQMLGSALHDPLGLEGSAGSSPGLNLLDFETTLAAEKHLSNVEGRLTLGNASVHGYEIHAGISHGRALDRPVCLLRDKVDGAISEDGLILGSYVHGLWDEPEAQSALLQWAGWETPSPMDIRDVRDQSIERLADCMENHLDMEAITRLLSK